MLVSGIGKTVSGNQSEINTKKLNTKKRKAKRKVFEEELPSTEELEEMYEN